MAGYCRLAYIGAAILIFLAVTDTTSAICTQRQLGKRSSIQQQQFLLESFDPCFNPGWCRRFPFARCQVRDCEARFMVGDTDVTDHCDVDNCGTEVECNNGLCVIDPLTNFPVCLPSCDFNNGGCGDDEVCIQDRNVLCIRFPCPQPVRCVHKNGLCNQKPPTGSCGLRERAFFYNAATQRCERFIYTGCGQSLNHFSTRRECRRTCRGVPDVCFNSIRCPPGTRCMADDRGTPFCQASCEYENGGCDEDEICRSVSTLCLTPPCRDTVECIPRTDVCTLPPETGLCKGFFTRYFYNSNTGRCESFVYGGCGGNKNNFIDKETCQETCGRVVVDPCGPMTCGRGFSCQVNSEGEAECIVENPCFLNPSLCNPCGQVQCPSGTTCSGATGRAQCIPNDACTDFTCEVGFNCRVNPRTNRPGCVIGTFACATILCPVGSICRVRPGTEIGDCGTDPCETHTCPPTMECRFNQAEDSAQCIPRPVQNNPCLSAICSVGHRCEVDANGKADCVRITSQDPCATLKCGEPNHICRVNPLTNQGYCGVDPCLNSLCVTPYECQFNRTSDSAECVPSAPCFLKSCPIGEICRLNLKTREGECVERDNRCDGRIRCPPGTTCAADSSIMTSARCVSVEDPCVNIDCGPDRLYICRTDTRTGAGYCGINDCARVRCGFNTECSYDPTTDIATCRANPCRSTTCSPDTICTIDARGEAECVNPCKDITCGSLICRVDVNTKNAYCGQDPCIRTTCQAGTQCQYNIQTDEAECVTTNPCAFTTCPVGSRCVVNSITGLAQCRLNLPDLRCFLLQCAAGFVCRVSDDGSSVQCVPDDQDPCEGFDCGFRTCRIRPFTQRPYCGVDPCATTTCAPGKVCRYNKLLDFGICVRAPKDPCENIVCSTDQVCEVDALTGRPRCVSSDPCEGILCSGRDICRIRPLTGSAFCGINPCASTTCPALSNCVYDPKTDRGRCVSVDNPTPTPTCGDTVCTRGDICRNNPRTGEPFCGITPCAFTTCPAPSNCVYDPDTDSGLCVRVDIPTPILTCDTVSCIEGQTCRNDPLTGSAFCGISPCASITCEAPSRCFYDPKTDTGRCMNVDNPTPTPTCGGTVCTGREICRNNPRTGAAFCGISPCESITCSVVPFLLCEYDPKTDTGRCLSSPPPVDCSKILCPPGHICEPNEQSVAECVGVCDKIACPRSQTCRVNNTTRETYCGVPPCRNFQCPLGQECDYDYAIDQPICVPTNRPSTTPCNPNPCPGSSFRCIVNERGNAECHSRFIIG